MLVDMKRLLGYVTGILLVAGGVGAAPGWPPGSVSAAGPAIVPLVSKEGEGGH